MLGEPEQALALTRECSERSRTAYLGYCLTNRAVEAALLDQHEEAQRSMRRALEAAAGFSVTRSPRRFLHDEAHCNGYLRRTGFPE